MFPFLKLIRYKNLLIIALTQCLMTTIFGFTSEINYWNFVLLVLSTVLIAAAGYIINDYFDVEIDKINKPERVIIDNFISKKTAMQLYLFLNGVGLFIGISLCSKMGFWQLSSIFILWIILFYFYSTIFKKKFLIGNLIVAFVIATYPLIITVFFYEYVFWPLFINAIIGVSLFAFLITLLREIVKDIEDYEGDKNFGCKTIPIVLGINKTKIIVVIIALLIVSSILIFIEKPLLNQYVFNPINHILYLLFTVQVPLLFFVYKVIVAKEKREYEFLSNLLKIVMITGILFLLLVFTDLGTILSNIGAQPI